MGVKSTRDLTRAEAIKKFVNLKMLEPKIRRTFEAEATLMNNKELEDALEKLNDDVCGGEGFENYLISDD